MFEGRQHVTGQVVSEAMVVAQTGEDQLELAVREHARLVYRIAYSVLRNHHDAEDATQETFVRVLRARRKLAAVDDPRRWLARVAWRVAVERKRKGNEIGLEDVSAMAAQLQARNQAADEELLSAELTNVLQQLIARLPRKLQEPLVLSTLEEMSVFDIAATLATSEAAIRSRLFRARQILRNKLTRLLAEKI